MSVRYFTIEEANQLLNVLRPIVGELLEKQAKIVAMRHTLGIETEDLYSNVGSLRATQMAQEFAIVQARILEIQSYGCVLKDLSAGLVDFLANYNGRDVYLCWRYGEERIEYYHDINAGFKGRKRIID